MIDEVLLSVSRFTTDDSRPVKENNYRHYILLQAVLGMQYQL